MSASEKLLTAPGGLHYRLRISRRRRTVGLKVTVTGELVVHAPQGLSRQAIHQVIEKNQAWIARKQAERREAWGRLEAGKLYYRGEALILRLVFSGSVGVRLADGVILVRPQEAAGGLWPQLLSWYHREAEVLLTTKVQHFATRMGLTAPPLEVCDWRRRWGECHTKGHLRFNWRLVLLPPEITDYVVVHDLSHLIVPGHPPRFWQKVRRLLPDYAARRSWLNHYGGPFLGWQLDLD